MTTAYVILADQSGGWDENPKCLCIVMSEERAKEIVQALNDEADYYSGFCIERNHYMDAHEIMKAKPRYPNRGTETELVAFGADYDRWANNYEAIGKQYTDAHYKIMPETAELFVKLGLDHSARYTTTSFPSTKYIYQQHKVIE